VFTRYRSRGCLGDVFSALNIGFSLGSNKRFVPTLLVSRSMIAAFLIERIVNYERTRVIEQEIEESMSDITFSQERFAQAAHFSQCDVLFGI
jgi:hypothetical protein